MPAQGAVPAKERIHQQEQAQQLRQALARRFKSKLQRAQKQADPGRQKTDQQQGGRARQHPAEQAHRQPQQQHADGVFHGHQPRAAFGQPRRPARRHQHQRGAHAEPQHQQLQAAAQRIAAGADVEQRTGQRRRYARRNQQAGHHAQHRRAPQRAALSVIGHTVQAIADGAWQFEFEHPEHRQCKHRKKQRERHQNPRRLQARLQVELRTEHSHQGAEQGKTGRHGQHVSQRQAETAPAAHLAAQHHARQNRQHRQYARGKGQAQARKEKDRQFTPAPGTGGRA